MPEWWEKAYPGGPMVGPPLPRPLYPPDAAYQGRTPSPDGPDILAIKRGIWRGGRWPGPASGFDDTYSNGFSHGKSGNVVDTGVAGFQRQMGIDDTGWMGEQTFNALRSARIPEGLPNAGQPLLDQIAVDLLYSYSGKSEVERVRDAIASFCERGMGRSNWSYSQYRPVMLLVNPEGPVTSDCSGSVIQAFYWAKNQTGIAVPDPSQQGWTGYGNTSYYEDDWPTVSDGNYLVGDLAHYNGHVTLCMKPGDRNGADWWSFGGEPAPKKVKLNYRTDLRKVVRPRLVP